MSKKFLENIKDSWWQYIQIAILFLVIPCCILFNFKETIETELLITDKTTDIDILKIFTLLLVKKGNLFIGIGLFIFLLCIIIKNNTNKLLNSGNHYHDHKYIYYWLCSHILGYKKCSLILVPVYMQIKLVLNDTFPEYYYGDNETYQDETTETNSIIIEKYNWTDEQPKVINIVVSDTYPIEPNKLPHLYSSTPAIHITRVNNSDSTSRVYSPSLIESLNNEVNKIPGCFIINLFATTNPKNLYFITKNIFQKAKRSNINHIVVFPQTNGIENNWRFDESGKRIY